MKNLALCAVILGLVFIAACSQNEPAPAAEGCTQEARACPDGSYVGRTGPDCEFEECPVARDTSDSCDYSNPDRNYVERDRESCATVNFLCEQGKKPFFDDCGCGCERVVPDGEELPQVFCTENDRAAEACTLQYEPVCGWSDPAQVQCITYPCAQTYGNSCQACQDGTVLYWTSGECPQA